MPVVHRRVLAILRSFEKGPERTLHQAFVVGAGKVPQAGPGLGQQAIEVSVDDLAELGRIAILELDDRSGNRPLGACIIVYATVRVVRHR